MTQEKASELLSISVRALSAYENGETIPSDETVERMVQIYGSNKLGILHLRNRSSLAREWLPEIKDPQSGAGAYMQLDFSKSNIRAMKTRLKHLLKDGEITPDEMEEFRNLQQQAKETAGQLLSICAFNPVIP